MKRKREEHTKINVGDEGRKSAGMGPAKEPEKRAAQNSSCQNVVFIHQLLSSLLLLLLLLLLVLLLLLLLLLFGPISQDIRGIIRTSSK